MLCYPHLKEKIECITVMGGGVRWGNRTPVAEFNIWNDPEAAQVVLESGVPVVLHGLDVTNAAYIARQEFPAFRAARDKVSVFIADLLEFFAKSCIDDRKLPGCPMHDSCAVLYLTNPEVFTYRPARVCVELDGRVTRGACNVDFRTGGRLPHNCQVAVGVNRPRVVEIIAEAARTVGEAAEKGEA